MKSLFHVFELLDPLKALFSVQGRLCQKAFAGIQHFKGLVPLNSQKHAESVVIDSQMHT